MKIRVFGYSDDNIMIDGAYKESVGAYNKTYVLMASGTVFSGEYDKAGVWRFGVIRHGNAICTHVPFTGERDDDDDSDAFDLLTIDADDVSLLWSGSHPPPDAPAPILSQAARVIKALRDRYTLDDRALAIAVQSLRAP